MLLRRFVRLLILLSICAASARAATTIPDVELQDQNGRKVKFYTDLVKDRVVAVNFIFTRCTTVCPGLGVSSAALARHLSETAGEGVTPPRIISISIDPENDTPERLRAWSENFGAAPGWTLVTGSRRDIDALLKSLQAYTPDINLHSSAFLLGNDATGQWKRVGGSAAPAKLTEALAELSAAPAPALAPVEPAPLTPPAPLPAESNASAAAARYFPDTVLLNQHGQPVHFYTDLLKGKVVVISTIFADCGGVCPLIVERFAKVQEKLGDRVGRDVTLISISVDPVNDTPERLHGYAERAGAKPGWHFLTGEKANVDFVLKRLGQYVESRDAHSNIFIIGNEPTGLWKKAFGLAPAEDVIEIVESVLTDRS